MSPKFIVHLLLGLLSVVILFHLAVLAKLVPYEIAWGGRLKTDAEMYVFEAASILINVFLCLVLLVKAGYLKVGISSKITDGILWFFLGLFLLNTVGNLFAKSSLEKSFAIVTLAFSVLIFLLLKVKKANPAQAEG